MLTVQLYQQYRHVVMYLTNVNTFPTGTVPAAARLAHRHNKRGTRSAKACSWVCLYVSIQVVDLLCSHPVRCPRYWFHLYWIMQSHVLIMLSFPSICKF